MHGGIVLEGVGKPGVGLGLRLDVGGIDHLQLVVAHQETQLLAGADIVGGVIDYDAVIIEFGDCLQQRLAAGTPCQGASQQRLLDFALLAVQLIDFGEVLVDAVGDVLPGRLVQFDIELEIGFQPRV